MPKIRNIPNFCYNSNGIQSKVKEIHFIDNIIKLKELIMKGYFNLLKFIILISFLPMVIYAFIGLGRIQIVCSQTVESLESPTQETYVSQVIIQAPWGENNLWFDKEESDPGEFGIHFTGEGPPVTPNGYTVAPNGA
jgi:hypothetical protein